jgi:hypothetical protein
MNRREVLFYSGSALACVLSIPAFAATAQVSHAHPGALPDDLPYEQIVAVNDAFTCFDLHDFTPEERAKAFGLDSFYCRANGELRDIVLTHVVDDGNLDMLHRAESIARISQALQHSYAGRPEMQRHFMNASSDLFSSSYVNLRGEITSGDYYDLMRAANILAR